MNLNRTRPRPVIRPLASIPNKEGYTLIGIRQDGSEALLSVYLDDDGTYKVPGYAELVGWRLA